MVQSKTNGPPSSTVALPKTFLKTGGSVVVGSGWAVNDTSATADSLPSARFSSMAAGQKKKKINEINAVLIFMGLNGRGWMNYYERRRVDTGWTLRQPN